MNLKLVGSSLIVAGTALGAGMLAIPMVLAQFGLLWGTFLMLFIWAGTTYAALLLLEASCKVGGGASMNAIARETLGKGGQLVTNCLLYALLVCLLMAYIIGAGDLVQKVTASIGFPTSMISSQVGFTLLVGMIVSSGTSVVDKLNRGLFMGMIVALVLTLFALAPSVSLGGLDDVVSNDKMALIKTSSVLFTSFGFMVVIPSLVTYNKEASKTQLRNMIIVGSTIPLVCYLLWLLAVVGNLPPHELAQYPNVTELISVLGQQYEGLEFILSMFTGLALLTSFLGVAMALYDQNADLLKANKPVVFVTTFVLPLLGAVFAPEHFLSILSYAGIILVFLAVFVPLSMTMRVRRVPVGDDDIYEAGGGVIGMSMIFLFGCFLLFAQAV
ncbi:tyrosine-specific transport protein [Vibrio sp. ES.051]|uniref:amino acid permease n=1 Tax=Vibrio sp. ES.051 TaxID=1761909 RepID=UPI000BF7B273|nr:aromatic amino acid transport family protein [Vibrio sp. ES.051]PFG58085.1 tyrosine-specific transport protein [Vibrio sp. ES.051]